MFEASSKRTNGTWISLGVWVALLVLLALVLLPASSAKAADLPPFPHGFYGRLTADNQSAPAGVTVLAKVDGIECGSITTLYPGWYGTDNQGVYGPLKPMLIVQSQKDFTIADGATIEFYVEGIKANETYQYTAGEVTYLELTVTGPLPEPEDKSESPGVNWAVVGGILGGAAVIAVVLSFILLRKRGGKT